MIYNSDVAYKLALQTKSTANKKIEELDASIDGFRKDMMGLVNDLIKLSDQIIFQCEHNTPIHPNLQHIPSSSIPIHPKPYIQPINVHMEVDKTNTNHNLVYAAEPVKAYIKRCNCCDKYRNVFTYYVDSSLKYSARPSRCDCNKFVEDKLFVREVFCYQEWGCRDIWGVECRSGAMISKEAFGDHLSNLPGPLQGWEKFSLFGSDEPINPHKFLFYTKEDCENFCSIYNGRKCYGDYRYTLDGDLIQ